MAPVLDIKLLWQCFTINVSFLTVLKSWLVVVYRDVKETLAYETETISRHSVFGPRRDRDQDLSAIPRDRDVWFIIIYKHAMNIDSFW